MSFFDWVKGKKMDKEDNVIKFPPLRPVEPVKPIPKIPPKQQEPEEHYRVGRRVDGMTTLTFMTEHGASMTLAMNPAACEQMIKMIRATYE